MIGESGQHKDLQPLIERNKNELIKIQTKNIPGSAKTDNEAIDKLM